MISLSRKLLNALGNSKRKVMYVVEVEVGGGIWRRFLKDRRDSAGILEVRRPLARQLARGAGLVTVDRHC